MVVVVLPVCLRVALAWEMASLALIIEVKTLSEDGPYRTGTSQTISYSASHSGDLL